VVAALEHSQHLLPDNADAGIEISSNDIKL
jgi:hypothetical protein